MIATCRIELGDQIFNDGDEVPKKLLDASDIGGIDQLVKYESLVTKEEYKSIQAKREKAAATPTAGKDVKAGDSAQGGDRRQ